MDSISPQAILLAIATVIGSLIGSVLLARAQLKRVTSQNENDDASAVSLYEKAAASRQKENDDLRTKLADQDARLVLLERRTNGPFRLTAEFTTGQEIKVTKFEISMLPPTQGD